MNKSKPAKGNLKTTASTGNLFKMQKKDKDGLVEDVQKYASPTKKNRKKSITDSDSKKFFEAVYDHRNDHDNDLLYMPLIAEEVRNTEEHFDGFEAEIKNEIQSLKKNGLRDLSFKDIRNLNISEDEEGFCDVGDENTNNEHTSLPKISMKAKTIKDIYSHSDSTPQLHPIKENKSIFESYCSAGSGNTVKDVDFTEPFEFLDYTSTHKNTEYEEAQQLRFNYKSLSVESFRMRSHILLPSKLHEQRVEEAKRQLEDQDKENCLGESSECTSTNFGFHSPLTKQNTMSHTKFRLRSNAGMLGSPDC